MSTAPRAATRIALALALTAGLAYVLIAVLQWRRLEVPSWDLAIFTQLAKAYAHFEAPIVPIKGPGFNLLGDHFHPILVVLGPLYRLWPSGLTLLVVQALLLAISVWPLTRLAVERLGRWPGLLIGVSYACSFGLQAALRSQFHEIAFAVPLLAFGLVALLRGRPLAAAAWLAPLVLVKEDLGLTVAVLGAVMVWQARRARQDGAAAAAGGAAPVAGPPAVARRIGWGLVAWGIGATVVSTQVLLPAFNPQGQWDYQDQASLTELFTSAVTAPLTTLTELLGPGEKIVTLLLIIGVAGVVGARSPLFLAVVPTLAWRFAGDVPFYWTWLWHYDAVLMPIATAALIHALSTPHPWGSPLSALASPGPKAVPRLQAAPAATRRKLLAITAALLAVALPAPQLPVASLFHPANWQESPRAAAARDVIHAVPEGADVLSDLSLLAYLVPRAAVRWIGTAGTVPPEYVVRDRDRGDWAPTQDAATWAQDQFPGTRYELLLVRDGYELARRLD